MRILNLIAAIGIAAVLTAIPLHAEIPVFFSQQWEADTQPEGWTLTGSGKTPSGPTAGIIHDSDSWVAASMPFGTYLLSSSSFSEGGRSNAALISPAIRIPSSGAILSFDAINYNPEGSVANKIAIYVFDDGEFPDTETTEPLFSTRIPANSEYSPYHIAISLGDYADKEIRLAIINEGNNCGLLGIGDISVPLFEVKLKDSTPLFSQVKEEREISASIRGCAPEGELTVALYVDGSQKEKRAIKLEPHSQEYIPLHLETSLDPEWETSISYTLNVFPGEMEEYSESFRGAVACGEGFMAPVVEEEGTGEKCGNCPLGAAGIARFSHLYPERFYGLAIHCFDSFSSEVMQAPSYAVPFIIDERFPKSSLPVAVINRAEEINPTDIFRFDETIESFLGKRSVAGVEITKVEYDSGMENIRVDYSPFTSINFEGITLSAAAVLTADGLTGTGPKWIQTNYFSGQPRPQDISDSWWEYMKFFYEYPSKNISPADYSFDHVALGIYPDYAGEPIDNGGIWKAGDKASYSISFEVPMQAEPNGFGVQDIEKTAVTLLIFDTRTGEIIAADRVDARDYNKELSGIRNIDGSMTQEGITELYTLTGIRVNPTAVSHGVYIKRTGNQIVKVIL